ncbi:PorV/PorQ family protein [bacterium]|nr:PorV/PorQ family protein [bacterium]
MKKGILLLLALTVSLVVAPTGGLAEEKLAQTGFQFLSVGTNARATGMGEAFTAIEGGSSSLFYNPAGMSRQTGLLDFSFSQADWIADIKYMAGSLSFNPQHGRFGVIGVSFLTVDYGAFIGTIVDPFEPDGYQDTGTFSPGAFSFGIGYSNQLTDRFSVGGQIKYVRQDLGKMIRPIDRGESSVATDEKGYEQDVVAFDFGTLYNTGWKSFAFGMTVRNFADKIRYEQESFELPLTFKIGFSINVMDFWPQLRENHSVLVAIDAVHPRSYPEYLNIGAEYKIMKILALRGGFVTGQDVYDYSMGVGINAFGVSIDYSYMPFDVFDDIHRFSVQINY